MKRAPSLRFIAVLVLVFVVPAVAAAGSWPAFRGPGARGVADGENLPVSWNVETGENVRWRTPIPGFGHSSPVVWEGRVFVTTAVADSVKPLVYGDEGGIDLADDSSTHTWKVLAISSADGKVLWSRDATSGVPPVKRHVKSSQSNPTPAVDGETLATILGPQGLFVFDLDGKLRWQKDLGPLDPGLFGSPDSHWGYASSPILVDGRVIVEVDRHKDSFLAAYDAKSGRELWKVARGERPVWATPTFHRGKDRAELIVQGGYFVRGYDVADGKELWRFADEAEVKTTTAFVAGERVILSGGYRNRPIYALKTGGSGELSAEWQTDKGGPYTSTPVVYGEHLYAVLNEGILSVYELATGKRLNRTRTDEHHSASLLASDGRIFLAGEGGTVVVVEASPELKEVARNDMGEAVMATPAIAGATLYVRAHSTLYAIGKTAAKGP